MLKNWFISIPRCRKSCMYDIAPSPALVQGSILLWLSLMNIRPCQSGKPYQGGNDAVKIIFPFFMEYIYVSNFTLCVFLVYNDNGYVLRFA